MKRLDIDAWGIASHYRDGLGETHVTSAKTRAKIRRAMQMEERSPTSVKIVRAGETCRLPHAAQLRFEDGTVVQVQRELPRDLPVGYYELIDSATHRSTFLLISPGACYLPAGLRAWGWAAQLYALRSQKSWGMGDLADLREFARYSRKSLQTDFLLINPLCANTPVAPPQSSPYFPSSRRFRDPLYLRIEEIPGAQNLGPQLKKLAARATALNQERLIDRNAIFKLKFAAFEAIWKKCRSTVTVDDNDAALHQFATFCVLAELHGADWWRWPVKFRDPNSSAILCFAQSNPHRVRFFKWLQALLELQLVAAAKQLPLIQDLPVGFDPAGADAWAWQDCLGQDMTIGAPPDGLNANGQNWGLRPFIPAGLREKNYLPFRQTLRAMLQHAKGLRIDHVMGLFRLFWIPSDASAREGAYVHYPIDELLAIVAIESWRAKAIIVGEDLGTVEPAMRVRLRRQKILSYRLLWFEKPSPAKYPKRALAAVSTHDLFTIAGAWTGEDLVAQKKAGFAGDAAGLAHMRKKLRRLTHSKKDAPLDQVILRTHQALAESPSTLITATLDDALMVAERPNMPGTIDEWPNWSIALPKPLADFPQIPLLKKISTALRRKSKTML